MKWLRWTLTVIAAMLIATVGAAWWVLRGSLPPLDGEIVAESLGAPAYIERDARGVPFISAATREDLAFATGFAHGQDRFFQMDLARRHAAGELSEIFGAAAVNEDRKLRRFGFRTIARNSYESAAPRERAALDAYARGVNAGLASLARKPFEYLLLRVQPRAWAAEDSALVVHSMWWQLQWGSVNAELERRRLERAARGKYSPEATRELIAFLYQGHTTWDTPNYAGGACQAAACTQSRGGTRVFPAALAFVTPQPVGDSAERGAPGSNAWALSGVHTANGAALVANDMHLDLGVPAVWYQARLRVVGTDGVDISGVTLPGTPAVAAGSNGHVAWGFTNSYGDFADVRWVRCDDADWRVRRERIGVKGAAAIEVEYRHSAFGVLLDGPEYDAETRSGQCLEVAWLATRVAATNFALLGMEQARNVEEVLRLAPSIGIPAQNMVVGDSAGRIAWVVAGRVVRESGAERYFGPLTWRDADTHPGLRDPPVGRLWSANQRMVDGEVEAVLGDDEVEVGAGGYDLGARARQIRDDLVQLTHAASPADMHAIQLDSRALFLASWRELLLTVLDQEATAADPRRAELRTLVVDWDAHATPDSVGYRLVRAYRSDVLQTLWRGATQALAGAQFAGRPPSLFEGAVWRLISEKPAAVKPPEGADWDAFLLARVDATLVALDGECASLARCTYGRRKPVRVRHPLSRAVPALSMLLDMPVRELAGDHHMPRVQDGSFGASERFAVSPGHERDGYLELPGGPSGHPLSSYYESGFDDWAAGAAAPFLPGTPRHKLTLRPRVAEREVRLRSFAGVGRDRTGRALALATAAGPAAFLVRGGAMVFPADAIASAKTAKPVELPAVVTDDNPPESSSSEQTTKGEEHVENDT